MTVLLSIKPEFATKIFDGSKKYEFRKMIFKRYDVKKIVVYVSSPIQRIIGEFDVEYILCDKLEQLWKKTRKFSGIDKDFFDEYFTDKEIAFAIKIGKVRRYRTSKYLSDYNINFAPQSFVYLTN